MKKSFNEKSTFTSQLSLKNTLVLTALSLSLVACSANEEYMSEDLESEQAVLATETAPKESAPEKKPEAKEGMDGLAPDSLDTTKEDGNLVDELQSKSDDTIPEVAEAAKPSGTDYTVKEGDTLSLIAGSQLGDASRWQEIATLNSLEDANIITVGQTLKLPQGNATPPTTTQPSPETSDIQPNTEESEASEI